MVSTVVRVGNTSHSVDSPFGYEPGNELNFQNFGAFDLGYMVNRRGGKAIGGLIEVGTGGFDKRLALKVRGQEWLSPSWAVSASVGPVRAQQLAVGSDGTTYAYGATGDIGVDVNDRVGLLMAADVTSQAGHRETTLRLGFRADSYLAVSEAAWFALFDVTIIRSFVDGQR